MLNISLYFVEVLDWMQDEVNKLNSVSYIIHRDWANMIILFRESHYK